MLARATGFARPPFRSDSKRGCVFSRPSTVFALDRPRGGVIEMSVPVLPFSKVRHAGSLVFLAGELPLSENGSIPDGIGPQTDLTLRRIAATLAGEGLSMADVVSCTVYLA